MPKIFDPTLETHTLQASHYGFSAENLQNLGSSEYTLVTVVVDTSSSVYSFATDIENCLKAIVKACRVSQRADNLMMRVVTFADGVSTTPATTVAFPSGLWRALSPAKVIFTFSDGV